MYDEEYKVKRNGQQPLRPLSVCQFMFQENFMLQQLQARWILCCDFRDHA